MSPNKDKTGHGFWMLLLMIVWSSSLFTILLIFTNIGKNLCSFDFYKLGGQHSLVRCFVVFILKNLKLPLKIYTMFTDKPK